MFFLPWATGVVVMVLGGILGILFIRTLPLFGGALLGIILGVVSIEVMRINDYVLFWGFLAIAPALACGLLAAYSEHKDGSGILSQTFMASFFTILVFPFSALTVNWIMGTFFNPLDHQWVTVNEHNYQP